MANLDSSKHVEVERPWLSISPYTGIVRMKASSLLSCVLPCWSGVLSRASFAPIMQPSNRGGDLSLRRTFQLDQKPFEPPAITLYPQQTMFQQYKQRGAGDCGSFLYHCTCKSERLFLFCIFQSYSRYLTESNHHTLIFE